MPRAVIILIICLFPLLGWAQTSLEIAYLNIKQGSTLPEDLLSSRTAVFLKVPPTTTDSPNHWKNLAQELHSTLAELKIDAMAYYQWQDLNSGIDASRSYLEILTTRDISQIVIVELIQNTYSLTIVPTTEDPAFLDVKAETWHASAAEFSQVLEGLSLAVRSRGLELGNFLVVESPEFFTDTPIFTNNRFESYQPDLKLDKLAIPISGDDNPQDLQSAGNLQIKAIFQDYPFQYDFVNYQRGEDLLRQAGFHYLLLYLYAPESSVRDLLDFQDSSSQTSRMVYKYYMRHIVSGDIYLGDEWDAAPTREEALLNHLRNMKRSLKVE